MCGAGKSFKGPKASWLLPYDDLDEPQREADRDIGEALAEFGAERERESCAAALEALADGKNSHDAEMLRAAARILRAREIDDYAATSPPMRHGA